MTNSSAATGVAVTNAKDRVLLYLKSGWWSCAPPALFMVGRQAYEETILTLREGPQMIGYSLMHQHPVLFVVCSLALLGLYAWCLAVTVLLFMRRGLMEWPVVVMYLFTLAVLGFSSLPEDFLRAIARPWVG